MSVESENVGVENSLNRAPVGQVERVLLCRVEAPLSNNCQRLRRFQVSRVKRALCLHQVCERNLLPKSREIDGRFEVYDCGLAVGVGDGD